MPRSAEDYQDISKRVIRLLPDDPKEALVALALAYANVVHATACPEENAVGAFRAALRQMQNGGPLS